MTKGIEKTARKTKEELFKERVETLTKKAILNLRAIGDLATKGGYNDVQVTAVFAAIDGEAEKAQNRFAPMNEPEQGEFSLEAAVAAVATDETAKPAE